MYNVSLPVVHGRRTKTKPPLCDVHIIASWHTSEITQTEVALRTAFPLTPTSSSSPVFTLQSLLLPHLTAPHLLQKKHSQVLPALIFDQATLLYSRTVFSSPSAFVEYS